MNSTVQVALIAVLGTVVTTLGLIIVAVIGNRREKEESAHKVLEKAHKERIELKDEIIEDLRSDLLEALRENTRLKAQQGEREKGKHD